MIQKLAKMIEEGKYLPALDTLDKLMHEEPLNTGYHFLIAQVLLESGKASVALPIFLRLSTVEKKRPQVWVNLGKCYDDLGANKEAQRCYQTALRLSPNLSFAVGNMASSLILSGDPIEAEAWARKYLREHGSTDRQAQVNLGFSLLHQRRYWDGAWDLYEAGLGHIKWRDERIYGFKDEQRYEGQKTGGILVYAEQGIGDQIAYAQCIPDLLADHEGAVVLDVQPKLRGLFARSFGVETHGDQFKQELDWLEPLEGRIQYRSSIASLCRFHRASQEAFTGKPYLVADKQRRVAAAGLLRGLGPRPKIGIAWTGGIEATLRHERSLTADDLKPFQQLPVDFIDLEYRADVPPWEIPLGALARVYRYPWLTQTEDLDDTAALVAELDLIIAVPTTVVHLAGALGVPCWCLLHSRPHFMFVGKDQQSMDWYESVRLFRRSGQNKSKQIHGMVEALQTWLSTRGMSHE